ncbi:MAG: hypothetical protein QOG63_2916 [Thermoleophilaceae bacterium]|nr:hypothetical protein [Thermoleophilaceae bacterium]
MADALTLRELNRATLARQLLLERAAVGTVEAIGRLAGMQAQEPKPPYAGLWTRLDGFRHDDLRAALETGEVVRATLMRATLHLLPAADFPLFRAALQPGLTQAMRSVGRRDEGMDLDAVLAAARELLAAGPRDFNAIRAHLQERFPDVNHRVMGYAVRTHLPLVMVPTGDRWGFPRNSEFALAEAGDGDGDDGTEELVRRYLAAFGPASAADVQTWSGLKGIKKVLDGMRDELATFSAEGGRELFDLPDAPRPGEDPVAPPRLLPEFDNLVLAHADRTRLLPDEHRGRVVTKNLRVRATFLVDGVVAGTWSAARKGKRATLTLEPFGKLPKRVASALADEAEALLRFTDDDASAYDVATT